MDLDWQCHIMPNQLSEQVSDWSFCQLAPEIEKERRQESSSEPSQIIRKPFHKSSLAMTNINHKLRESSRRLSKHRAILRSLGGPAVSGHCRSGAITIKDGPYLTHGHQSPFISLYYIQSTQISSNSVLHLIRYNLSHSIQLPVG